MTSMAVVLGLLFAGCSSQESGVPSEGEPADARSVHDAVLVLDGHADVLLPETPERYHAPGGGSRVSFDKLQAGGVDAVVLSLAVGPGPETPEGVADARRQADAKLASVRAQIEASQGKAALALSADDVERLHQEGKIAVVLGFQNARILGEDLAAFDAFHSAGVRIAGLTHAGHNAFSDSSRPTDGEVDRHKGLSQLGRDAVARFNDLGVLVDVSQLSKPALLQTLALSRAPVVASHSNARALVDNTRNLDDEELDAIKAKDGVVLAVPFTAYLREPDAAALEKIRAIRVEFGLPAQFSAQTEGTDQLDAQTRARFNDAVAATRVRATLSDYVDHIDYIAKRIGVERVGIGSDFDHGSGVDGFDSASEAPNVTAELLKRGYSEAQIKGIWGGNFLRVWRAAVVAAKR